MKLSIECEREADGRWIAEIVEIPGAMAYGSTREEAMGRAEIVALRAIADRIEHGEAKPLDISISLAAA
ncbi:MAG: type II toxin-antitoxin system HicB family antitoxin [Reyranella sp.]|uniref:type II toxin-antitoxin system HicB family antitoxin n=1 Tax=Reyranella sp. TaxID=1929291 RepID=UPI0011F88EC1|nr:type II toxin-antitoxin system HicB family antitoxin [Reyranella sp.]TAJ39564.1 MAG: type II toxin-antitoxin system HicB family antitoxin [Reyranella sp.]